ncbi:hypothetical protein ABZP36_002175 [Zizania latifolia]
MKKIWLELRREEINHDDRGEAGEEEDDTVRSRLGAGRKLHLLSAPARRARVAGGDSARRTSSRLPVGISAGALPALPHPCHLVAGVVTAAAAVRPPAPHQLNPSARAGSPPPLQPGPGALGALLLLPGRLGRGTPRRAAERELIVTATASASVAAASGVLFPSSSSLICRGEGGYARRAVFAWLTGAISATASRRSRQEAAHARARACWC